MSRAIVSLGSNLGDRKDMLHQALERISFSNKILSISDVYETYPQSGEYKDPYLNCCIELETDMSSFQLMQFLNETERQLTTAHTNDRFHYSSIDCDLIAFESEVIMTPQLTLPHPDAYRRAFVMIPLAEIKPDWTHPILNKKATELAKEVYWAGWGTFFANGKSLLDF
jgi:2-amino-4-hydroxy-6-hydroxymethyldihydropteridine diphosphokinase